MLQVLQQEPLFSESFCFFFKDLMCFYILQQKLLQLFDELLFI